VNPPAKTAHRPPAHTGPGRPRKPRAPRTEKQAELAVALELAETRLDKALAAYAKTGTVKVELAMLKAMLGRAAAWSSYLLAQGNHTHALKWAEQVPKMASRIAGLRELLATDLLLALKAKRGKEDALGKGARV
jgi:hypothetical protein